MPSPTISIEFLLNRIREVYDKLPFNRHLGISVTYLTPEGAGLEFAMREELIGNYVHGILHGGVISSVLDVTGGLTATISSAERLISLSPTEIKNR